MKTRVLGRTGLSVSELSLGTASLGLDYGIPVPDDFGRPNEDEAVRVVQDAVAGGITFIDTAPAYGNAERLLGRALVDARDVVIATKLRPSAVEAADPETIRQSIDASRTALKRDVLDVLQIPNATESQLRDRSLIKPLLAAKDAGLVRFLGATVYDREAALAAIDAKHFDVVQIAFDLLDQRKLKAVIPRAHERGVAIVVRSAFLKGVLTRKAEHLPPQLDDLRARALEARDKLAGKSWDELAKVAVRFCLTEPRVSTVLAGVRTRAELASVLEAVSQGSLPPDLMARAQALAVDDDELLNPRLWPSIP